MPCCEDAAAYSLQTRPNSGGRRSNGAPDPQAALKAARKGNHTCTPAAANTLRFERLAVEVLQGLGLPVGDARTHARTHARTRTIRGAENRAGQHRIPRSKPARSVTPAHGPADAVAIPERVHLQQSAGARQSRGVRRRAAASTLPRRARGGGAEAGRAALGRARTHRRGTWRRQSSSSWAWRCESRPSATARPTRAPRPRGARPSRPSSRGAVPGRRKQQDCRNGPLFTPHAARAPVP